MRPLELQATTRVIFGKKVKSLRRAGIIPLNVYGHGMSSIALQAEASVLDKLLSQAGTTHLVSLIIDGAKPARSVIIKEVQRKGGTGNPIHVSFYQVKMEERIRVEVPIYFTGESPAVKAREADLMINLRTVEVECLPDNIPSSIVLDLGCLSNPGDAIRVKDLGIGKDITLLSDPEQIVVKVEPIRVEVEEVVEEAEAKVVEAAEPEEKEELKVEDK